MREIKYRLWDKEHNRWYEPTYEAYAGRLEDISLSPGGDLSMRRFKIGTRQEETIHESKFPDRFVISQFTGLKDRNGKEIYDGDIVSYEFPPLANQLGEFTFDEGIYYIKGTNRWRPRECEVVGNIYDNPELLKS